jgi:hypothetical protein
MRFQLKNTNVFSEMYTSVLTRAGKIKNKIDCCINKVIQHVACQNHTYECENHTHDCLNYKQSAKFTPRVPISHAGCQHHTHDVKITLLRVV